MTESRENLAKGEGVNYPMQYNHAEKAIEWGNHRRDQIHKLQQMVPSLSTLDASNAASTILGLKDAMAESNSHNLDTIVKQESSSDVLDWSGIDTALETLAASKGYRVDWEKVSGQYPNLQTFLIEQLYKAEENFPNSYHNFELSIDHKPSYKFDRKKFFSTIVAKGTGYHAEVKQHNLLNLHGVTVTEDTIEDIFDILFKKRLCVSLSLEEAMERQAKVDETTHAAKAELATNLNMEEAASDSELVVDDKAIQQLLSLYEIQPDDQGLVRKADLTKVHNALFRRLANAGDQGTPEQRLGNSYKYANTSLTYALMPPNSLVRTQEGIKVKITDWIKAMQLTLAMRAELPEPGSYRWEYDIAPLIQQACSSVGLDSGWLLANMKSELQKAVKQQKDNKLFAGRTGRTLFLVTQATLLSTISTIKSKLNARTKPYAAVCQELLELIES
jgi:hypothetical protein